MGNVVRWNVGWGSFVDAGRCEWDEDTNELKIHTRDRFLRTDSVNITGSIGAMAEKFQASYTVTGDVAPPNQPAVIRPSLYENTLTFCMKFPKAPPASDLYRASELLASLMWGRPAKISSKVETNMTSFYDNMEEQKQKKSKYQEAFEKIMQDDMPLVSMDLNQPSQIIKPGPPEPVAPKQGGILPQQTQFSPIEFIEALSKAGQGYPFQQPYNPGVSYTKLPNAIDVEALKKLGGKPLPPEPQKNTASPSSNELSELATLENEDLGRDW